MAGSYPSIHFDAHNRGYIPDQVGGQRDKEAFETIWSFETAGMLRASPVVSDELVVVGDLDGNVYGIDAIDAREQWRTDLETPSVFAAAAIAEGTVFVSGFDDLNRSDATTFALDLASGDVQWTRDFGQGGRTAVATDGELVYVPTYDGVCHALSPETGETVWQLHGERYKKTPALSDGLVILGDGDEVVALDAERGTERWRTSLNGHVQTPPVVASGRVYVVARRAQQWCLDIDTGEPIWDTHIGSAIHDHPNYGDPLLPLGGGALDSKPVTDRESLMVSIYNGIVEFDAVDGRLLGYHPLESRVQDPLLIGTEGGRSLYGAVSNRGLTELQCTADGPVERRSTALNTLDTVPAYAAGVFYLSTERDGIVAVT